MKQLIDSVNDLQVKYKDLIDFIEEVPALISYLKKKPTKNKQSEINL